jgi:branched-chain amino acid transport system substrate-binding protein
MKNGKTLASSAMTIARQVALVSAMAMSAHSYAQEIKIAYNGDLSASPNATAGRGALAGIEAAVEDINKGGGVLGRKLTLLIRDDVAQPGKSIQHMTELIDNEKVVAVFGPTNSGNALAWKRIPNEKKVISFQCVAEATDVTKPTAPDADNYIFRLSMYDRAQAAGLVAYAKKSGTTKVGLMAETTGYGESGLRDLQDQIKIQGLPVVATEKFGVADTDMTSQLTKMKAAGVDTILVWAQGTPMGLLLRSMEKINYFPVFLVSAGAGNTTFFDSAGKTLAPRALFLRAFIEPETPAQKQLYERVAPKLAGPAAFISAMQGYDSTLILAAAIRQAGVADGAKVKEALENLQAPVPGVYKTYAKPFSKANHEALTPADAKWARWSDGRLVQSIDAVTKSLTPAELNR